MVVEYTIYQQPIFITIEFGSHTVRGIEFTY